MSETKKQKKKAGACACGAGCENHPEPDPMGRYRCTDCMCFTADPGRRHGWCRAGSIKKWSDEIALATKR